MRMEREGKTAGSSLLPRATSKESCLLSPHLGSPLTLDTFFTWSVTIPLRLHHIPSLEFVRHIFTASLHLHESLIYPECFVKSAKVNCQSHNRCESSTRCGVYLWWIRESSHGHEYSPTVVEECGHPWSFYSVLTMLYTINLSVTWCIIINTFQWTCTCTACAVHIAQYHVPSSTWVNLVHPVQHNRGEQTKDL